MKIIDAFGKQCPMPLVMAKKEIDSGCRELAVQVDNETAVKNLTRLGKKTGLGVSVDEIEGGWLVSFGSAGDEGGAAGTSDAAGSSSAPSANVSRETSSCAVGGGAGGCGYAVFVGKDFVGDGDRELGHNLMKMALYTLSEAGDPPVSLFFMNAGVKLPAGDEDQVVESIKKLEEQGTEVLVCGTCLDFFDLKDQLKVGEVSNMYDILERMREAAKVISL